MIVYVIHISGIKNFENRIKNEEVTLISVKTNILLLEHLTSNCVDAKLYHFFIIKLIADPKFILKSQTPYLPIRFKILKIGLKIKEL